MQNYYYSNKLHHFKCNLLIFSLVFDEEHSETCGDEKKSNSFSVKKDEAEVDSGAEWEEEIFAAEA